MDDSEGRASGGSPAARVADDPMQHAGCDEPPVLRGGADVIDRCQFAGEGLGGGVRRLGCRSPAVQGCFRRGGTDRGGGHGAEMTTRERSLRTLQTTADFVPYRF